MWVSGHTPLCMSGNQRTICGSRFSSTHHVGPRNCTSVIRAGGTEPAHQLMTLLFYCAYFYSLFLFIKSDIDILFIVARELLFKIVHLSFESVSLKKIVYRRLEFGRSHQCGSVMCGQSKNHGGGRQRCDPIPT